MPKKQTLPLDRRMWTQVDEKGGLPFEGGKLVLYTSKKLAVEEELDGEKTVRVQVQVDET